MKTISILQQVINIAVLDEELRAVLGSDYLGLSTHGGEVRVHLTDATPAAQTQQVEQIVLAHDASVLTAEQQAEQARQQALTQFRADNSAAINLSTYGGAATEVQALAAKIAWLELEIRDLRGL